MQNLQLAELKAKERQSVMLKALEQLSNEIITDPERLAQYAQKWSNGFHNYSFHNMVLIMLQKPEASICAGFKQWNMKGRYVKSGEKAIWILAPVFYKKPVEKTDPETEETEEEEETVRYFINVPVFDVSQTDGELLDIGANNVKGTCSLTLDEISRKFDYPFEIVDSLKDGSTDYTKIRVAKRKNPLQMVAAYFHELAHIRLEHQQRKKDGEITRALAELEAEATSYIVCSCLEIDNEAAKSYIGHWKGTGEKVKRSGTKVLSCAEKILRTLDS